MPRSASRGTTEILFTNKEVQMKGAKHALAIASASLAIFPLIGEGSLSDDEIKRNIADFLTLPSRLCGRAIADFRSELRGRRLTNRAWFDGDTNRLASLIVELAQTNDAKVASIMVNALGEYGNSAQLPFLYSCATNPIIGDRAVKSILKIEGVSSNSLSAVQSYLSMTNGFPLMNRDVRIELCESVIGMVFDDSELISFRPLMLDVAYSFAHDANMFPNSLDLTLLSVDPDSRYTKRRLSILRSTRARLDERIQSWDTNDVKFATEAHIYEIQTNYLVNAINELVAYPEANLPD